MMIHHMEMCPEGFSQMVSNLWCMIAVWNANGVIYVCTVSHVFVCVCAGQLSQLIYCITIVLVRTINARYKSVHCVIIVRICVAMLIGDENAECFAVDVEWI